MPRIELVVDGRRVYAGDMDADDIREVMRSLKFGPPPSLAVDAVVIQEDSILLVRRKNPPFQGIYALPGGFVRRGERTEDAVIREVAEETGVRCEIIRLVGIYSEPERDPRGHTVSVAYLLRPLEGTPVGGDDAAEAGYFPVDRLPPLAFDHVRIVKDALKR